MTDEFFFTYLPVLFHLLCLLRQHFIFPLPPHHFVIEALGPRFIVGVQATYHAVGELEDHHLSLLPLSHFVQLRLQLR